MSHRSSTWRSTPPDIKLTSSLTFSEGESINLGQGSLQGFYDDRQQIVQIDLLIPAGTWFESLFGTSQLMVSLLKSGTKNYSSESLNICIEETGGNIAIQRGTFYIHIVVQGLSHVIPTLLDLLFDMLCHSEFAQKEVEKRAAIMANKLRRYYQQPEYRASKEISKILYGKDHPYGRSLEIEHLYQVNEGHIQEHAEKWLKWHKECIATISGAYNKDIVARLQNGLHNLRPSHNHAAPDHKSFDYHPKKKVTQREGSRQHAIRLGHPTISAHHEDAHGLRFVNNVLGGFFGSRLMSNIREDKGFTYGIQSSLHQLKYGNSFVIGTEVAHQYTEATLKEINLEIRRLQDELITEPEWQMMQNYYNGLILRSVNSAFSVAKTYRRLTSLGIPLSSIHKDLEISLSLEPKKVQELARKHINIDQLSQVIIA